MNARKCAQKVAALVCTIGIAIALIGCASGTDTDTDSEAEQILFRQDFESAFDTSGWSGVTHENIADGSLFGSTGKCLVIGGGCTQPSAELTLKAGSGWYTIRLRGFCPDEGQAATILLGQKGEGALGVNKMDVTLNYGTWQTHSSRKHLTLAPGTANVLQILVGGIVPARVVLDDIEITYNQEE